MRIKVANLLLLGGAFLVAGIASGTGISQYDGGDFSGLLTVASLILFAVSGAYLWSHGAMREQRAEWDSLIQMLGGEYSFRSAGVHGGFKGMPVYARVESLQTNADYLDRTCAMYSDAKYFFTLTVTLPYRGDASWRVLYKPKNATRPHGEWHTVCEQSQELAQNLEASGVSALFSAWDPFTVVKCEAEKGELTLRYPAPHRFFCPTTDEIANELSLLRRVGAVWQHALRPQVAA